MVVHTNKGEKKDTKVLMSNDAAKERVARGSRSTCPIITSIFFNIVMLLFLLGAGYYLCRYKRVLCDMQVQHGIEKLEAQGMEYQVKDCEVFPLEDNAEIAAQDQGELEIAAAESTASPMPEETPPVDAEPEPRPLGRKRHRHSHHRHHHKGSE